MKTLADLEDAARRAIDRGDDLVYDVASESSQIFGNVKHMRWFRLAVMREKATSKTWEHLLPLIPEK